MHAVSSGWPKCACRVVRTAVSLIGSSDSEALSEVPEAELHSKSAVATAESPVENILVGD